MSMIAYKAPFLLQIMMDDEPLNPRTDYDNFGHMVCWYRQYEDGEQTDSCWNFFWDFSDVKKEIAAQALPKTHWDMVDHLQEVSDTVIQYKGYEAFMEDLEEMEA